MTKENQRELKALDREIRRLDREFTLAEKKEHKAIAALVRNTSKITKGIAKQAKALQRRREILVGRLS